MIQHRPTLMFLFICWLGGVVQSPVASAQEYEFLREATPVLREYCFDCHGNDNAEAHINLEALVAAPNFATRFRTWEKVMSVVREKQMPPEDMPQPDSVVREKLADGLRQQLGQIADNRAGDPGRIVMRRLTSAEYGYTIRDLTGFDFDLESILIGDAVGGEGFTNVGDVQFVQDSTLERYLEAAKLVASHAVIGSGPLQFSADPGKTGLELSAIHRIQAIYRKHGFRIAAGEGGEPFGQDLYPRGLYVAWQFRHRAALGEADATLADFADKAGLSSRFAEHLWTVLNQSHASHASFPLSDITTAWARLPPPTSTGDPSEHRAQTGCQSVADLLRSWQGRLARNAGDDEEAALLTKGSIRLAPHASFRANIDWPEGDQRATVHFVTASATGQSIENAQVVWRNPRIQFRRQDRRRSRSIPLVTLLPDDSQHRASFGARQGTDRVDDSDLVLGGNEGVRIEFEVPEGSMGARLTVEAVLQTKLAPTAIVRCTIRDGSSMGDTAADTGEVSTILGKSRGQAFETWRAGALDFAKSLPDVSHREPAPSDRDPIPAPFDNGYNTAERNDFHYSIKYHRDDAFLVDHVLDDATRRALDHAWTDLLSSFDYHDTYLAFVAKKNHRDLAGQRIGTLPPDWVTTLPMESRVMVRGLVGSYIETRASILAAHSSHVEEALEFAQAAWRRPLHAAEADRLRAFYREMTEVEQLGHTEAIRVLLSRILVAPQFLYRVELPVDRADVVALSQWELASRLSYFLWSSPPDSELLQIAADGRLDDDNELTRQTHRMLRDARTRRFATEFFGQWFGFYRFDKFSGIDANRFPEFDDQLKSLMYEEAVTFFEYIVQNDRCADEILFADYAHWNDELAKHYNLPLDRLNKLTTDIQLVSKVNPLHRGGLLGLGVVHAITSAPLRTSAVKRGDWILRRVLGTPVPPPPADVGSIPADDVLSDGKTVRDRLVAHRQDDACVNCHSRMDPLGFAMENFDPIGRWRQRYRDGNPIDASGTLSDGANVNGVDGLQSHLRAELPKFHRVLSSKLLGYALGRGEILSDRLLIEKMTTDLKQDIPLAKVIARITTSPQFRTKRGTTDVDPD